MSLPCIVSEIWGDSCRKSLILTSYTCIWCPVGSDPIEISPRSLASDNYSSWDIIWHCFHDTKFNRFDTILARDGQTDDDSTYSASIAMCSKNGSHDPDHAPFMNPNHIFPGSILYLQTKTDIFICRRYY